MEQITKKRSFSKLLKLLLIIGGEILLIIVVLYMSGMGLP